MSTKIFNGYRIVSAPGTAPGTGRPDVFAVADAFRAAVEPVRRAAYAHLIATLGTLRVDEARHPKPQPEHAAGDTTTTTDGDSSESPKSAESTTSSESDARGTGRRRMPRPRFRSGIPAFDIDAEIEDAAREIEATGRRNPELDLQCEVTFLHDPTDPSVLYALLFTEREDYRAAWAALPGVQEFRYWNNTDAPDEVTDTDWDTRGTTWDRILGRDAPVKRGLGWTLVEKYMNLNPLDVMDQVAAAIPSVEDRAKLLAYWRVPGVAVEDGAIVLRDPDTVRAERATLRAVLESQLEPVTVEHLYEHLPTEHRKTSAPA